MAKWIGVGIVALWALSLLAFIENGPWWSGLLVHGRGIYGVALLGAAIAVHRKPRWLFAALIGALLNLGLVGLSWRPVVDPAGSPITTLTILHLSIDRHNQNPLQSIPFITETQPDLLFLQEITPENLTVLEGALKGYKLVHAEPRKNSQGSAVWRREDLTGPPQPVRLVEVARLYLPADSERPLLAVWLEADGREIAVLSVHTTRPRSHWTAWWQREELRALAMWSREQQAAGRATILVGDFNATPWSGPMRALMEDGGLEPAGTSPFARGSWPGMVPVLPIDLAMVGDGKGNPAANEFNPTQRRPGPSDTLGAGSPSVHGIAHMRGPYIGGDHRPVVYAFQLFPFR